MTHKTFQQRAAWRHELPDGEIPTPQSMRRLEADRCPNTWIDKEETRKVLVLLVQRERQDNGRKHINY